MYQPEHTGKARTCKGKGRHALQSARYALHWLKYKFTRLGFDQWSSEARPRSRNTANERVVSASKHGKYEGFFFNIKLCSMKKICKLTLSVINIFPSLRYS